MKMKEQKFEKDLDDVGLKIVQSGGDGNCLFRSIAFQAYGDQELHKLVRAKCMQYISVEREYFKNFIEGGESQIDDYIARKSCLGVWGDDIEIQAMTEIYDNPVEIYAYDNKPMKTFHEASPEELNLKGNKTPFRLSYHGE